MFIADDVLMFPFKSVLSIFREIYNAAVQEMAAEADAIRAELSQLYLALEAGTLAEEAFDARESRYSTDSTRSSSEVCSKTVLRMPMLMTLMMKRRRRSTTTTIKMRVRTTRRPRMKTSPGERVSESATTL